MKIVKRPVTAEDIEKHPQITEWGVSVGQELEFARADEGEDGNQDGTNPDVPQKPPTIP